MARSLRCWLRWVGLVLLAGALPGCASLLSIYGGYTPLPESQVADLTTCKGVTLDRIRKNLALAGYDVIPMSGDQLTTGYKQIESYGHAKTFRKFNIIAMDKKTIRFKPMIRSESLESVETDRAQVGSYTATSSQLVNNTNEADEPYYKETLAEHIKTKKMICGA